MTATRNTKAPKRAPRSREKTGSASKAKNKAKTRPVEVKREAKPRGPFVACAGCGLKLRPDAATDGRCERCAAEHAAKFCACGQPSIQVTRAWLSPICVACAAQVTMTVGALLKEDPRQLRLFP